MNIAICPWLEKGYLISLANMDQESGKVIRASKAAAAQESG